MSIFSEEALKGKHILITGATGGIGYETAKIVAGMGASVSITGRNQEKLTQLYTELTNVTEESNLSVTIADITQTEDRVQLVKECEKKLGTITGLVNAAAIAGNLTVDNLTEDYLNNMMNINHTSTIMLTQLVYQKMLKKREGAIVNVSSLSGLRGTFSNSAYCSSKFALIGFTQSLALEAIQANIRVNAVCPGYVDTNMARDLIEKKAKQSGILIESKIAEIEASIPSGKISTTIEVANTIAFLLTDATGNIIGESIKISGGSVL
ncbi:MULTISPECIES: SDR family NAD(P)-dependent oxidoreductase [unclassified Peribacillus]|uniref:SDR family NAD(P)-dependent oxidoreductase n=1 Tax=unclassified Peribacillus TaxID=2675266 RepID=UPI001F4E1FAF|nr:MULTISPECIES: SDR family oxidoreductase [unclassified Peribacillus]MCK1985987.1 SDR family oxidoreductase [Peribacillus sp. Aquil_B1]MCK2011210.1 SDR family oxidoreductase [Peribacillus sp. Aquil_B8]